MTQPAQHHPYTYMCAVCYDRRNRRRKAQWLTPEGWYVCSEHRRHAETHGVNALRVKL